MPVSFRRSLSSPSSCATSGSRVVRADRPRDRLLREVHRVVGRAADPDTDDSRRARLAARADDRLEHELLDPGHAVGGNAHLEEAHVLGARALRDALHVEPVPVGDEVPVHDRDAVADVRPRVLARQRVHGVRAQRMLDGRALRALLERGVDPRRVQREVLADLAVVDGDAGVLAHEVLLVLGDRDVAEDRLQNALPGHRGLAAGRVRERVSEVLRDVLQGPDVQVRGGICDCPVEIGRHDAHRATSVASSSSSTARASSPPARACSTSGIPCGPFASCISREVREHRADDVEVTERRRCEQVEPRAVLDEEERDLATAHVRSRTQARLPVAAAPVPGGVDELWLLLQERADGVDVAVRVRRRTPAPAADRAAEVRRSCSALSAAAHRRDGRRRRTRAASCPSCGSFRGCRPRSRRTRRRPRASSPRARRSRAHRSGSGGRGTCRSARRAGRSPRRDSDGACTGARSQRRRARSGSCRARLPVARLASPRPCPSRPRRRSPRTPRRAARASR